MVEIGFRGICGKNDEVTVIYSSLSRGLVHVASHRYSPFIEKIKITSTYCSHLVEMWRPKTPEKLLHELSVYILLTRGVLLSED